MSIGTMRINPTRTQDGRKIDTWEFTTIEAEKIPIAVTLHATNGAILFRAVTSHPLTGKLSWQNSDIDQLRREVQADLEAMVSRAKAAQWKPACALTTKFTHDTRDHSETLTLSITLDSIHYDALADPGNKRRYRISNRQGNGAISTFHETGFREDPPERDSSLGKIRINTPAARRLVPIDANRQSELRRLCATLETFANALADTLGPDFAGSSALPSPGDLAVMMTEAARLADS